MSTQVQTFVCRQGGEGENVWDCAIRNGFDHETYRVEIDSAHIAPNETIVAYVKARRNDAAFPILRRGADELSQG